MFWLRVILFTHFRSKKFGSVNYFSAIMLTINILLLRNSSTVLKISIDCEEYFCSHSSGETPELNLPSSKENISSISPINWHNAINVPVRPTPAEQCTTTLHSFFRSACRFLRTSFTREMTSFVDDGAPRSGHAVKWNWVTLCLSSESARKEFS